MASEGRGLAGGHRSDDNDHTENADGLQVDVAHDDWSCDDDNDIEDFVAQNMILTTRMTRILPSRLLTSRPSSRAISTTWTTMPL